MLATHPATATANTRQRALARRQLEVLKALLDQGAPIGHFAFYPFVERYYLGLNAKHKAYVRDLNQLINMGAARGATALFLVSARLDSTAEITEKTNIYKIGHVAENTFCT
jgi:hypothetical protein